MTYTYEIISVDETARSMEVLYSHATHGSILVGVRLPFVNEDLEVVIQEFAPLGYWRNLEAPVATPAVGAAGELSEVESIPPSLEEQVRAERNVLLIASDWTQVADAPVDQAAWATYRQDLRDIPQQAGFPDDVTWPTKPE